jgi:hypothetical protein
MSGSFQAVFSRNSLEKTKPVYIRDGQGKKKDPLVCQRVTAPFVRKKKSIPHLLFCGSPIIDHQQPASPGGRELSSVTPPVVGTVTAVPAKWLKEG